MDLKDLDTSAASQRGFELELLHPTTGKLLGMFITVLGRDSDTYTKLQTEQNRKRLDRAQKLGMRRVLSLDEIERDAVDLAAACTLSWRSVDKEGEKPVLLVDGEELQCNVANAVKLYTNTGLKWVLEQVDAAIVDRSNFLKR